MYQFIEKEISGKTVRPSTIKKELQKHFNVVKDTKSGFRTFWIEIEDLYYAISIYQGGLNLSPNIQQTPTKSYTNKHKELPESHRSTSVSKEGISYIITELKRLTSNNS